MDLYLVRHGVAHDQDPKRWPDDTDRPLTSDGEREFLHAARALARVTDAPELVLSSSFARAWRTAELLSEGAAWPEPQEFRALEADRPTVAVLAALAPFGDPRSLALVGHEPGMSELAWLLLAGEPRERVIRFKKGGVALLKTSGAPTAGRASLRWLLTPQTLRAP
ncbi:MAG: histidine phosphatase family protein [Actinomycetota bacterium]|nr:histidine phosphatase family protein [Actinomycetota bacterium]